MVNLYGEPALCDFDVTGMHLLDHQQCFQETIRHNQ